MNIVIDEITALIAEVRDLVRAGRFIAALEILESLRSTLEICATAERSWGRNDGQQEFAEDREISMEG